MEHQPDRIDVEELVERQIVDLLDRFHDGQRERKARYIVKTIVGPALSALEKERDALKALVGRMVEGLEEVTGALEAEVKARAGGELPRRIARDLEPVVRARSLLSEAKGLER